MIKIQLTISKQKFLNGYCIIFNNHIFRQHLGAVMVYDHHGHNARFLGHYSKVLDTVATDFGTFKLQFVEIPIEKKVKQYDHA